MDYSSPEISFHPEMRGKCWITILRNHSFHKYSIGMFCFILEARAVTVTSSVFCSIKHVFIPSSGSEDSSKRTQRMAFSAAIVSTLASSEQGVQRPTVSV